MKGWRFWAIWTPLAVPVLIGLFNHELWLDEMHHWLLARDSANLLNLAHNARFEAHPLLWNVLLWMITRFTTDPLYMQIFHGLLAIGVLAVWVRYTPFPWYVLVLGGLGYFLLYEYAAISRNYALGVLGLFLAATVLREKPESLLWITLGCLLAVHSHLLFLIPGVLLFGGAWLKHRHKWPNRQKLILTMLFILLLIPAIYWCIPSSGQPYLQINETGLFSRIRIEAALHSIPKGLVPIPDMSNPHWWNTNWLEHRVDHSLAFAALGITLLVGLAFTLRGDRLAMGLFVLSTLVVVAFIWLSEMRGVRYTGPIWISYLVAWWISKQRFHLNWEGLILILFLILQGIAGVLAWKAELYQQFSQGKAAAEYLQTNHLDNLPIYSFPECAATVTVGYLGTSACYPQTGVCGSYCQWPEIPPVQDVRDFWENLHKDGSYTHPGILLLNQPLPFDLASQVETIQFFNSSQVRFDNVYLYRY